MKYRFWLLHMLSFVGVAGSMLGATCATTPVSVTISPTYSFGGVTSASMIYPDRSDAYVDGVDGTRAFINTTCTNDLVLDLNNSARHVGFSFQSAAAVNSNTPAWTPTPFLASASHFVVGNLMFNYNATAYYQFTTIGNVTFTPPGGRTKDQDQVCFANPQAQVYKTCGDNVPFQTTIIVVTHSPADPLTGSVETWTITPDTNNNQLGTLLVPLHSSLVNGGQFSLPFQFIVTRRP